MLRSPPGRPPGAPPPPPPPRLLADLGAPVPPTQHVRFHPDSQPGGENIDPVVHEHVGVEKVSRGDSRAGTDLLSSLDLSAGLLKPVRRASKPPPPTSPPAVSAGLVSPPPPAPPQPHLPSPLPPSSSGAGAGLALAADQSPSHAQQEDTAAEEHKQREAPTSQSPWDALDEEKKQYFQFFQLTEAIKTGALMKVKTGVAGSNPSTDSFARFKSSKKWVVVCWGINTMTPDDWCFVMFDEEIRREITLDFVLKHSSKIVPLSEVSDVYIDPRKTSSFRVYRGMEATQCTPLSAHSPAASAWADAIFALLQLQSFSDKDLLSARYAEYQHFVAKASKPQPGDKRVVDAKLDSPQSSPPQSPRTVEVPKKEKASLFQAVSKVFAFSPKRIDDDEVEESKRSGDERLKSRSGSEGMDDKPKIRSGSEGIDDKPKIRSGSEGGDETPAASLSSVAVAAPGAPPMVAPVTASATVLPSAITIPQLSATQLLASAVSEERPVPQTSDSIEHKSAELATTPPTVVPRRLVTEVREVVTTPPPVSSAAQQFNAERASSPLRSPSPLREAILEPAGSRVISPIRSLFRGESGYLSSDTERRKGRSHCRPGGSDSEGVAEVLMVNPLKRAAARKGEDLAPVKGLRAPLPSIASPSKTPVASSASTPSPNPRSLEARPPRVDLGRATVLDDLYERYTGQASNERGEPYSNAEALHALYESPFLGDLEREEFRRKHLASKRSPRHAKKKWLLPHPKPTDRATALSPSRWDDDDNDIDGDQALSPSYVSRFRRSIDTMHTINNIIDAPSPYELGCKGGGGRLVCAMQKVPKSPARKIAPPIRERERAWRGMLLGEAPVADPPALRLESYTSNSSILVEPSASPLTVSGASQPTAIRTEESPKRSFFRDLSFFRARQTSPKRTRMPGAAAAVSTGATTSDSDSSPLRVEATGRTTANQLPSRPRADDAVGEGPRALAPAHRHALVPTLAPAQAEAQVQTEEAASDPPPAAALDELLFLPVSRSTAEVPAPFSAPDLVVLDFEPPLSATLGSSFDGNDAVVPPPAPSPVRGAVTSPSRYVSKLQSPGASLLQVRQLHRPLVAAGALLAMPAAPKSPLPPLPAQPAHTGPEGTLADAAVVAPEPEDTRTPLKAVPASTRVAAPQPSPSSLPPAAVTPLRFVVAEAEAKTGAEEDPTMTSRAQPLAVHYEQHEVDLSFVSRIELQRLLLNLPVNMLTSRGGITLTAPSSAAAVRTAAAITSELLESETYLQMRVLDPNGCHEELLFVPLQCVVGVDVDQRKGGLFRMSLATSDVTFPLVHAHTRHEDATEAATRRAAFRALLRGRPGAVECVMKVAAADPAKRVQSLETWLAALVLRVQNADADAVDAMGRR